MWTAENTYQMIKQILYNCEADCTVLIRKPQVISGGVRTPCTLPLDPPLSYECVSSPTVVIPTIKTRFNDGEPFAKLNFRTNFVRQSEG